MGTRQQLAFLRADKSRDWDEDAHERGDDGKFKGGFQKNPKQRYYHASPAVLRRGDVITGGHAGGYNATLPQERQHSVSTDHPVYLNTSPTPHATIARAIPGWPGHHNPDNPGDKTPWHVYEVEPGGARGAYYVEGNGEYQAQSARVLSRVGLATNFLPKEPAYTKLPRGAVSLPPDGERARRGRTRKELAFLRAPVTAKVADQPRDAHGRFGTIGGLTPGAPVHREVRRAQLQQHPTEALIAHRDALRAAAGLGPSRVVTRPEVVYDVLARETAHGLIHGAPAGRQPGAGAAPPAPVPAGGAAPPPGTAEALHYFHGVESGARPVDPAVVSAAARTGMVAAGLLQPRPGGFGHQLTDAGRAAAAGLAAHDRERAEAVRYFHGVESGQRTVDRGAVPPNVRERLVREGVLTPIGGGGHRLTEAGRALVQPIPGASPPRAAPPQRPTPQPPAGPHMSTDMARAIHGGTPELQQEAARALTDRLRPEVQELLRARPLASVRLAAGDIGSLGLCQTYGLGTPAPTAHLSVDTDQVDALHATRTDRRGIDGWRPTPWEVKPPGISYYAATPEEKRQLMLIHEVGHAVHNMHYAHAKPIMDAAYARARTGSGSAFITNYSKDNAREYFAESFALYNHSPEKLRVADPVAHDMVRDVVAATRAAVLGRP